MTNLKWYRKDTKGNLIPFEASDSTSNEKYVAFTIVDSMVKKQYNGIDVEIILHPDGIVRCVLPNNQIIASK